MAININIQTQRSVPVPNNESLTLAVLQYAFPDTISRGEIVKLNAYDLDALETAFHDPGIGAVTMSVAVATKTITSVGLGDLVEVDDVLTLSGFTDTDNNGDYTVDSITDSNTVVVTEAFSGVDATDDTVTVVKDSELAAAKELYALEYLLSSGVSVLAYPVLTKGTIAVDDITNIQDIDVLQYRMVVAPFLFVDGSKEALLTALIATSGTAGVGIDAQLFLDLDPDVDSESVPSVANSSPKIEVFVNCGYVEFASRFTSSLITTEGSANFKGLPSSLAAVTRKAKLLRDVAPWVPVAGERNGKVTEFLSLYRDLSTIEKENLQAANINVLISRIGIGPLFVSQNTQYSGTGSLVRSHAATVALAIKRYLNTTALATKFLPNNQKTWTSLRSRLNKFLQVFLEKEGITSYQVAVGLGITMTAQDVADGILKAAVNFVPISVVETIIFNVVIRETDNIYDVQIDGGVL